MVGDEEAAGIAGFAVRPLRAADAGRVAALWLACTAEVAGNEPVYTPAIAGPQLAERLRRLLADAGLFGCLAEADGELAGYVTCEVQSESPLFRPRSFLYVHDLDVAPAHRGRRLSYVLMAEVERYARARGLRRIELGAANGDARSRAVWERHGFRPHFVHLHKDLDDAPS